MKNLKTLATMLGLCLLFTLEASAKPAIFKQFKTNYPNATKAAAIGCALCHANTAYARNSFGADVENNFKANAGAVKWADLENIDSDGDAYTNLEEINAGTNPGDRNSKPTTH